MKSVYRLTDRYQSSPMALSIEHSPPIEIIQQGNLRRSVRWATTVDLLYSLL